MDNIIDDIRKINNYYNLEMNLTQSCFSIIENFKQKIRDYIWMSFTYSPQLSEEFIREMSSELDSIDWAGVSSCQNLSENFIREFQNKVDWKAIFYNQKLSSKFIEEFKDKFLPYIEEEYEKIINV